MSTETHKTVKIDFSDAKDRAELLSYICEKMKLTVAETKTRFKVNGPTVGYEALTNVLRGLKISYSWDSETNVLIAEVPLVQAVGINAIMNPDAIPGTSVDNVPADKNKEEVIHGLAVPGTEPEEDLF